MSLTKVMGNCVCNQNIEVVTKTKTGQKDCLTPNPRMRKVTARNQFLMNSIALPVASSSSHQRRVHGFNEWHDCIFIFVISHCHSPPQDQLDGRGPLLTCGMYLYFNLNLYLYLYLCSVMFIHLSQWSITRVQLRRWGPLLICGMYLYLYLN